MLRSGSRRHTYAGAESAMLKVAQKYDNVCVVLEDIGTMQIDWFKKNAPYRIVECGIAEANAVGYRRRVGR